MRYEAKVDLRNANTSHALLIELVGRDKRVLDVGCASGYLGETLRQRGCTVAGVEYDAEAAEAAKAVLDEVVVGDVGELDLVGHFGAGRFDAVVFGDVLEHVVDPVGVLRRLRPLLAPGGAAVISIPNVAHGAVRLSLMSGRFDYRPLGLLDDTHLRFFTRDSLHDLLAEAGFVAVDVRRTVAGVFDTEVAVRRQDFDDHVVEAVEDDPDATTYQFVVKAVPREEAEPPGAPPPTPPPARAARCRVGIWADCAPDDATGALGLRVTRREVAARLPGAAIRLFTARGYLDQSPHTGGEPVEPMGELSPERLAELADQLDCLVLTGDVGDTARSLGRALDQGPEGRCPVLWSAVRPPAGAPSSAGSDLAYAAVLAPPGAVASASDHGLAAVPDPLVLADRVLPPQALSRRLAFLRVMGWFPGDGDAVVVEVGGALLRHAAELAPALRAVARPGLSVVLVQLDPADADAARLGDELAAAVPAYRLPPGTLVDDAVAALAAGACVAVSSPAGLSLALAHDRPLALLDLAGGSPLAGVAGALGAPDAAVADAGELAGLGAGERFRPLTDHARALRSVLDRHFDRVAAIADGAAAARPRVAEIGPTLPPSQYAAALETAHARMQRALDGERTAVADHLAALRDRHRAELDRAGEEVAALRRALAEATGALGEERRRLADQAALHAALLAERDGEIEGLRGVEGHLAAELEALRNIRTLRVLRPLRSCYAALRRALR